MDRVTSLLKDQQIRHLTTAFRISGIIALSLFASCGAPRDGSWSTHDGEQPTRSIVVAAHPLAVRAGIEVLKKGGNAVDAAVAVQMVLTVVEPQSSGIGGGAILLHWSVKDRSLTAFDGLAQAPSRAPRDLFHDVDGTLLPDTEVTRGGRSAGVPGTVKMLWDVHQRFGALPWETLFDDGIAAAKDGFPMPSYLNRVLRGRERPRLAVAMPEYFDERAEPLPVGTAVQNPPLAETLRRIASDGPKALYTGDGADRLVGALRKTNIPTLMEKSDLNSYTSVERIPVCGPFLVFTVCTAPPPSFGGIFILQVLGLVERRREAGFSFENPVFVHLFAEAGRLASADAMSFIGDPGKVAVPVAGLLDRKYLDERAIQIEKDRTPMKVLPGNPPGADRAALPSGKQTYGTSTSHIVVADSGGNIVSMTTTNNQNFGSQVVVDGFVVNNAMTNFAPAAEGDKHTANEMAPGKRPFTSMSPIIAFDRSGHPIAVGGSAGALAIPFDVAKSLIDLLANDKPPKSVLAAGHVAGDIINATNKIQLEKGTSAAELKQALAVFGHDVQVSEMASGLAFVRRVAGGWIGSADPRRDGTSAGD